MYWGSEPLVGFDRKQFWDKHNLHYSDDVFSHNKSIYWSQIAIQVQFHVE